MVNYVQKECDTPAADLEAAPFDAVVRQEEEKVRALIESEGDENPYHLGAELGDEMTAAATVVKTEPRMRQALDFVRRLQDRYRRVRLSDTGMWTNQNLSYARALHDMLILAEVILLGSIERKESRGSHYRTDYPERNDEEFLATTVARFDPQQQTTRISFEPVDTGLVPPRPRTYGKVEAKPGKQKVPG